MRRQALAVLLALAIPTAATAQTLDSGTGEQSSQNVERQPAPDDQHRNTMTMRPSHQMMMARKPPCRSRDQTNCVRPPSHN